MISKLWGFGVLGNERPAHWRKAPQGGPRERSLGQAAQQSLLYRDIVSGGLSPANERPAEGGNFYRGVINIVLGLK